MRLELLVRSLGGLAPRPLDLRLERREALALRVARGVEPLGVESQPRFGIGHQLLLALGDRRQLRDQALLGPFEIARELGQPLADALLHAPERLAELGARVSLLV